MDIVFLINLALALIVGGLIGSFLNVIIYRFPKEISIVWPGSGCPKCNYQIKWYDNIPVFSWLILLRGKCRKCQEPISIRYPLTELITSLLFALIFINFGIGWQWLFLSYFICLLIVISWIDIDHMLILNSLTYPGTIIGLIYSYLKGDLNNALIGAASGAIIFLLISKVSLLIMKREGMGMGDVTLVTLLGSWLGVNYLLGTLAMSFLLGSLAGVVFYFLKGRSDYFPFGPFLVLGAFFTLFTDNFLIKWYLRNFLLLN